MKVALIALFLIIGSAIAGDYVALKASTYNKDKLIQSLRQIGYEYVLQKGIFESTKAPLPNGSWKLKATDSVTRKIDGSNVYYQFIVQLECVTVPTVIRARYNITFNKNSGNTLVTYFIYTVLSSSSEPVLADLPQFIDVRLLSSDETLKDKLDEGVEYIVNEAICEEDLPDSDYRVSRVFSIKDTGFSFPYGYHFLVKLANTKGKYYNVLITVFNTENLPEEDVDKYPPTYQLYPTV